MNTMVVTSFAQNRAAEAFARGLLGSQPTQGRCQTCRRFYYFAGPGRFRDAIRGRRCPICRNGLARTTWQCELPRFVIRRGNLIAAIPANAPDPAASR